MICKQSGHKKKYFCLHCFKTFKGAGSCCGWDMYEISYKARPPKKNASKTQWRSFFQIFLKGHHASKGQLKRIIEIRSEYGLSIFEQQTAFNKMVETHERSFRFLDIKRHEALMIDYETRDNVFNNNFIKDINKLVINAENWKTADKFNLNKKYFMVPIHAKDGYKDVFPPTVDKYKIYKVSVSFKDSVNKHAFKILTDNIDETYFEYKSAIISNTGYAFRQRFLIFDTKEKAMAFRCKYLKILIPFLKTQKKGIVTNLEKEADSDFNRVARRSPELLI